MLKRTDWRSLQWTEDAASEPIQWELPFSLQRPNRVPQNAQSDDLIEGK
jgi:hypothetical protein